MPSCSLLHCNSRKNNNKPLLTLHKFPNNNLLRKKWLDVIGIENVNARHKTWYVCSLHFEHSCFNRTLDVVRLRDNTVPSLSLVGPAQSVLDCHERASLPILSDNQNIQESTSLSTAQLPIIHQPTEAEVVRQQAIQLKKLTKICEAQRKKLKVLHEKIRRRDHKIANLNNIIKDLKRK